jgi:hypothetical protein
MNANEIREWIVDKCMDTDDPESCFEDIVDVVEQMDLDRSWLDEENDDGLDITDDDDMIDEELATL